MTTDTLPVDADDVSASWLTGALAGRHPGTEVTGVEIVARTLATNLHLRVRPTYATDTGAPPSLFVKLPPLDPAHRAAIGASGMGVREAQFYADVAASCGLRVPETHFTATAEDGSFVLLLEDLAAAGCRFSDGSWGVPVDAAAGALEDLARFHARFEDEGLRRATAPWADVPRPRSSDFTTRTLRWVLDERGDVLTDDYVAVGELFIDHTDRVEALWDEGPRTFIHGDPHVGNVFLDGDRVGFVDWGLSRVGSALRDVSYFLTMTVEAEGRDDAALLRHYLDAHRAAGGADLPFDDVWRAHRLQAGYTVIASFLSLTPTYDTDEVRAFGTAFRRRSERAIEELGTVAALREALAG